MSLLLIHDSMYPLHHVIDFRKNCRKSITSTSITERRNSYQNCFVFIIIPDKWSFVQRENTAALEIYMHKKEYLNTGIYWQHKRISRIPPLSPPQASSTKFLSLIVTSFVPYVQITYSFWQCFSHTSLINFSFLHVSGETTSSNAVLGTSLKDHLILGSVCPHPDANTSLPE